MSEPVDGTCEVCEVRPATEFFDVGPHNEMCAQCTLDAARERLSDAGKLALRLLPTGAAGEGLYTKEQAEAMVALALAADRHARALRTAPAREPVAEDDRALQFAAWLTTRPGVMVVGASEHSGPMAEAVHEWRTANPPTPSGRVTVTEAAIMSAIEQAVLACAEQVKQKLPTEAWSINYAAILTAALAGRRGA